MSLIGKKIEEFSADAFQDGEFLTVTNESFEGKWSVVVFYPADFTFVCPTELEDLQDQYATLKSMGVEVYSVSTDTHFAHKAWHDSSDSIKKIKYIMIGDPTHKVSRLFDVLNEETGLSNRGTFIINPEGVVQTIEITTDGIGREASATVAKVKAAQYIAAHPGEVCPAKWKEGEETLKTTIDLVGKI